MFPFARVPFWVPIFDPQPTEGQNTVSPRKTPPPKKVIVDLRLWATANTRAPKIRLSRRKRLDPMKFGVLEFGSDYES